MMSRREVRLIVENSLTGSHKCGLTNGWKKDEPQEYSQPSSWEKLGSY